MRSPSPAVETSLTHALAQLRAGERREVFARQAETHTFWCKGTKEVLQHTSQELAVACRIFWQGRAGFGAAAGTPAEAGGLAVRAATEAAEASSPGPDPLPPRQVLGSVPLPPPEPMALTAVQALWTQLLPLLPPRTQAELFFAKSWTALATSEGFTATWPNHALSLQLTVPGNHSLPLLVRWALPGPQVALEPLLEPVRRVAAFPRKRVACRPHLARVLLLPQVAAPLLVALVRHLPPAGSPVSPLWRLADLRRSAFLPLPCDAEGFPGEDRLLLAEGKVVQHLSVWPAGGGSAVRPSWNEPPQAGPWHLQQAGSPLSLPELVQATEEGFVAWLPLSRLQWEKSGRFSWLLAGQAVHQGSLGKTGVLELSGSLRQLLLGLSLSGGAPESLNLECTVTTPALLIAGLHAA